MIADIVDVARMVGTDANAVPHLGFSDVDAQLEILDIEQCQTAYYLRMQVSDKVGVMAKLAQIMSEGNINIEAILQKEPAEGSSACQ